MSDLPGKDILLNFDPNLKINVLPHPVVSFELISNIAREENFILFAGAMHRNVNQDAVLYFYEEVIPIIRKEMSDIKFCIVGSNPPERIQNIADNDQNVVVTGYVCSLSPYYEKATIFVSPIFVGGGIIVKNLDAMAHSLPVVTTSIGNEGIEAVPERDILIADTSEEFLKKVVMLLKDEGMRTRIGEAGRRFVEEKFSLKQIIKKIEHAYHSDTKHF